MAELLSAAFNQSASIYTDAESGATTVSVYCDKRPTDLARLTIYVTDLAAYRAGLKELGTIWRARLEKHYPAVALVEVKGLVDRGAVVEMEATAVIPDADGWGR